MEIDCLPYSDTGYFSKIVIDYLEDSARISPFYQYKPQIDSFAKAIEQKSFDPSQRSILAEALERQYEKGAIQLKADDSVKLNITALREDQTFTVTTGHQLCLFTGPLYFFYKIASTIKLSRILSEKFPDQRFVPVYWMASEDHDFEEINHFYFKKKKMVWETDQEGAVGRMKLSGLDQVFEQFSDELADYATAAEELKNLFRESYLKHENLADATRYLVHQLFGEHGIVILDGDDVSLKGQFKSIVKDELLEENSSRLVEQQSEQLAEHYKIQVNPREINLFYLKEDLRKRIVKENGAYFIHDTSISFTEEELLAELEKHPERFSPNVILRPLYQERILPNLAYIGGGGELAYWFQLKSTFEHFQLPMPVLLLRNSAMWMDEKQNKYFKSLNLPLDQLFLEQGVLLKNWVKKNADEDLSLSKDLKAFSNQYTQLENMVAGVDASLKEHVGALASRQRKTIEQLSEKLIRSERKKQEATAARIAHLKTSLFPGNSLQERHDNFSERYLSEGKGMIEMLIDLFEIPSDQFYSIA